MADDLLARIANLEAMNDQLLKRVVELGIEIQRTRTGGFRSMRDSRRCPACGQGAIVHVRRAQAGRHGGLMNLGLTHSFSQWTGTKSYGPMESYSCRGCGLVELHVIDFAGVDVDGEAVVEITAEGEPPSDGPFR